MVSCASTQNEIYGYKLEMSYCNQSALLISTGCDAMVSLMEECILCLSRCTCGFSYSPFYLFVSMVILVLLPTLSLLPEETPAHEPFFQFVQRTRGSLERVGLMWKTSSVYRRHHYLQVDVNTASTLYQLMLFLPYSYLILGYTPQR